MTISLELPDQKFKIAAFLELVEAMKRAGIRIDMNSPTDARRDALAFAVESIQQLYANTNWRWLLQDLVNKVSTLKSEAEASWFLDREIVTLFKAVVVELMARAKDESHRKQIQAVSDLFLAAKKKNQELHQAGKSVNFGGIPGDLLPKWYTDRKW